MNDSDCIKCIQKHLYTAYANAAIFLNQQFSNGADSVGGAASFPELLLSLLIDNLI